MTYTNKEIACAAGLQHTFISHDQMGSDVDWYNDPGAVAAWLLPVLEKRWPNVSFDRSELKSNPGVIKWYASESLSHALNLDNLGADEWHECVIEAIMATAPTT